MHVHILGICGTFMGGIALLARANGHRVTGQDANVYPPMSTQLEDQGIELIQGFDSQEIKQLSPDVIIIGNALSRGNSAVEYVLEHNLHYTSGAQWLAENILQNRWVLAVAGTHGKTTTSSMLVWILEYAGLNPGFLIGGVPENFGVSARNGEQPFFVVEADEYDTAFFDKRSKFVHYHPRTVILNNLEFDHADIFDNLDAIKKQFHHLIRTVPGNGLIIYPQEDTSLKDVLSMGCWSNLEHYTQNLNMDGWSVSLLSVDGSSFEVFFNGVSQGIVEWDLVGLHNVNNAVFAISAARHSGVPVKYAIEALSTFKNVKRRMEVKGISNGITVYDDFAHHPTAIATTIDGLRRKVGNKQRIIAILEPRSNTMKMQVHNQTLPDSLNLADEVFLYLPDEYADKFDDMLELLGSKGHVYNDIENLKSAIVAEAKSTDHLLVMSNGGFCGIHQKLLDSL
ncbi:MAG: UDP-N-acetylmuramate:L-alanyl-gamma-D-glutamyl-meso-diaminopimelate ligase [gamma proteobacterium symbiont of Bathyaustriella thionipta]|nr:UDP-N-acetylmuramate:L-alanyl-gamma-D-glutamyl-meso-diaminopimelate ligase [gamma proteobacterium symbiont of Bathyaustriella thionipta]MCU7950590.1 UDP-N-acetylmuramate:L-alanyl-gamma-D-glutamyl-meso-diaminopimelate ligase [gamma proteobacterium symbiont of Bathyaustriella thionipta]MCU7953535.1 UDP-N-acetylmuramate:L-alanyl-gamma-D-glutamyl-meso-diaminopimelate ligase [gamma proteobacterium symbiont of Bathyaustriella thionipta]MCU7957098.1 UDP-N-acetylmuramate:L-alanyl-gamma-D-glutamyl-mes